MNAQAAAVAQDMGRCTRASKMQGKRLKTSCVVRPGPVHLHVALKSIHNFAAVAAMRVELREVPCVRCRVAAVAALRLCSSVIFLPTDWQCIANPHNARYETPAPAAEE